MGYAAITMHRYRSNSSAGYKRLEQCTETIYRLPPRRRQIQKTKRQKNAKRGRPLTSGGPLEQYACFLLPLTFRLAEFFIVSFQRSRTDNVLTSYARFFVENQCMVNGRNADRTFNRSAHHAYTLDDTIPA